jgi:hypothetical protein
MWAFLKENRGLMNAGFLHLLPVLALLDLQADLFFISLSFLSLLIKPLVSSESGVAGWQLLSEFLVDVV